MSVYVQCRNCDDEVVTIRFGWQHGTAGSILCGSAHLLDACLHRITHDAYLHGNANLDVDYLYTTQYLYTAG